VGPRAGLEGRKISSIPGFDPGPPRYPAHIMLNTVSNIRRSDHSLLTKNVRELLCLPTNLNTVQILRGVTILNSWNKTPPKNTKYCNRLLCRVTEFWNKLRARENEDRRMLCEDTFQNVIKLH